MSITSASDRTLRAISIAGDLARARSAELVLFIKDDHKQIREHVANLGHYAKVWLYDQDLSVTLLASIGDWAQSMADQLDRSTWVQILAEDDYYCGFDPLGFVPPESKYSEMVCPMVFHYGVTIVLEDLSWLDGATATPSFIHHSLKGRQPSGDSSWHALIRGDVFRDYFTYLNALPTLLPHHSNGLAWLSLCKGELGVLQGGLFVKDCMTRADKIYTAERFNKLYLEAGATESDTAYDFKMYVLFLIALICHEIREDDSPRARQVLTFLVFWHRINVVSKGAIIKGVEIPTLSRILNFLRRQYFRCLGQWVSRRANRYVIHRRVLKSIRIIFDDEADGLSPNCINLLQHYRDDISRSLELG